MIPTLEALIKELQWQINRPRASFLEAYVELSRVDAQAILEELYRLRDLDSV